MIDRSHTALLHTWINSLGCKELLTAYNKLVDKLLTANNTNTIKEILYYTKYLQFHIIPEKQDKKTLLDIEYLLLRYLYDIS